MTAKQRKAVKAVIDEVMGSRPGDGCGPTEAAAIVAERTGVVLTPREAWNIWLGEQP